MRRRNARCVGATDEWTSCELECAMTPAVRDDTAKSHLMSSQLGWNQPGGEVLNFSSREKVVARTSSRHEETLRHSSSFWQVVQPARSHRDQKRRGFMLTTSMSFKPPERAKTISTSKKVR